MAIWSVIISRRLGPNALGRPTMKVECGARPGDGVPGLAIRLTDCREEIGGR
jgi:hypothetical protein